MALYKAAVIKTTRGIKLAVQKFDRELNFQAEYLVTKRSCDCPAGEDSTCRHRKMFGKLLSIAGQDILWNFEDRNFVNGKGEFLCRSD